MAKPDIGDKCLTNEITLDNENAFKKMHDSYYVQLCQFAFLFLKSKELSEEVVSDVFLKVWINREKLRKIKIIKSYLYKAVRNQSIDYIRMQSSYEKDAVDVYEVEIISSEPIAEDTIILNEKKELLQQAVNELPEKCRMILRMYINDQLTYKEIADILNISRKTVETQITIAIRKLQQITGRKNKNFFYFL